MLKVYIYRPDKKEKNIEKELLYNAKGEPYREPKKIIPSHPIDKIYRPKIKSSYVEVER